MKAKTAYILITSALVMGAFLIGKTTHQPSIPVDDISAYYVDCNGNLNLEMKDVRCIEDNWRNPIYTNYLAEQGIPDITAQTENNILNLASVTDYEATETTLTLTDRNGDSWVIEKYREFYRISDYARFCKYDYTCGLFDGCWSFKSNKEVRCI